MRHLGLGIQDPARYVLATLAIFGPICGRSVPIAPYHCGVRGMGGRADGLNKVQNIGHKLVSTRLESDSYDVKPVVSPYDWRKGKPQMRATLSNHSPFPVVGAIEDSIDGRPLCEVESDDAKL